MLKSIHMFLSAMLWFSSPFAHAASEVPISSYLKDLEELGVCVIPQLLSASETEVLYERVWHEFIEKAWPNCRLDDRSNWKEEFPMHNLYGVFAGPAGQIQVMWDLRQDPRIVDVFAQVWNTKELIVSMDGLSIMCPLEIREGYVMPWPHVDQTIVRHTDEITYNTHPPIGFVSESPLKTKPFTIQGQFLFEDSFEGDGGFYCIPKSHLRFDEFAPTLETIAAMPPSEEKRIARNQYCLRDSFGGLTDENGNPYCKKQIQAPKGSLILWDSRTVHWNQHASKDRPNRSVPKVRMVGYLSYEPKSRMTDQDRIKRKEAFEMGVSTGHRAASLKFRYTKDLIDKQFKRYLEDPSYMQPTIQLSPLGESLLN